MQFLGYVNNNRNLPLFLNQVIKIESFDCDTQDHKVVRDLCKEIIKANLPDETIVIIDECSALSFEGASETTVKDLKSGGWIIDEYTDDSSYLKPYKQIMKE